MHLLGAIRQSDVYPGAASCLVVVRLERRWKSGVGKCSGWNREEVSLGITLVIDGDPAYGAEAVGAARAAITNSDELSSAPLD